MPEHRTVRGRLMEFDRANGNDDSFPWNEVVHDEREMMAYGVRFKIVSSPNRCRYILQYADGRSCKYEDKSLVIVDALNMNDAINKMEPHMTYFATHKLMQWEKS
jgi:hypothetical protein